MIAAVSQSRHLHLEKVRVRWTAVGADVHLFPYQRVVVVGVTSAGKSTLAESLAKRFELNYIELDALHWQVLVA